MVEYLPGMCEVLGLIPIGTKKEKKRIKLKILSQILECGAFPVSLRRLCPNIVYWFHCGEVLKATSNEVVITNKG